MFDKEFLKRVLSIPSVSGSEDMVRDYILGFADRRGIGADTDAMQNVYLTKGEIGEGEFVPCFVNHMDTVQEPQRDYVERGELLPVQERMNEQGMTELYVDGFGIGGDDKAGVALALALIDALPKCKAVFFVEEEKRLHGSDYMDYSFLHDVSLLITMDCWGRVRTASEWRVNGARMYTQEFYENVLKEVFDRHKVTELGHPANTDACKLMVNSDLCCCDIGNGGYFPHKLYEYVCVEDAIAGYNLILDLCHSLGTDRQYHFHRTGAGGEFDA